MTASILDSIKQALGVPVDEPGFDPELMMHINAVFSTLRQLGVGPDTGFVVTNKDQVWADLLGADLMKYQDVVNYTFMRVKLLYDTPPTSFAIEALKEQIKESEWRMNVTRESLSWVDPDPTPVVLYEDPTLF